MIVGSSSVRLLANERVFPGVRLINRGFGGAHISDINANIEPTVLKYEPSKVVFFCGNNDLWYGRSVAEVEADFESFRSQLFDRLPECQLFVLALRPSPERISIMDRELAMNERFEELAASDDRIVFLRGSCDRFLDSDGKPIEALYAEDRLHMNDDGYHIWKEILTPYLVEATP
ncbi:MAG: GDSL-type esterase/lipase family protein [Planctomycetota bacterium]